MNEKKIVGEKAVEFIKDGMVVGLGTGTTVYYSILKLGQLVKEGLDIQGIPTSVQTEVLAKQLEIPLVSCNEVEQIDVAIDGADAVNSDLDLIKGGGGALLREKIVAKAANKFIVVATPSKMVGDLGSFRIPVEVVPFGIELTEKHIQKLGINPFLRKTGDQPYKTDNGNYIFDCSFPDTLDIKELELKLNLVPGVVENGLFINMSDIIVSLDDEKNILLIER